MTRRTEVSTSNNHDEDINDSRALKISKLLDYPVDFPKAIQLLRKSSFLSHQSFEDGGDIRIHDLVRSMIRHRARQSMCDSLCFRMAAATVDYAFSAAENPWLSSKCWSFYERVLPHYRSLVAFQMEQQGCSIDLVRASSAVASYLECRGRVLEAFKTIKEILPLQEDYHGVKNLDYLQSLNDLARLSYSAYDPEAESLLKQSLISKRDVLGDTHLDTLETMTYLADFYSFAARHEEALALMEMVVENMKLRRGTEHKDTLKSQCDLAKVYEMQGRYMKAESLLEAILDTAIRIYGMDSDSAQSILHVLGLLKFHLYRLDAADLLLTRADAWGQRKFEFVYSEIRRYLGCLRNFQGDCLEAESLLKVVVTGYEKSYGPTHVFTTDAMDDLAWLYIDMERFGNAEVLFSRAVEILEQIPDMTYGLKRNLAALAFVIEQQGRVGEAETLYRRVLDQSSQWPEDEFLGAAPLSRLFSAQGRTEEAQSLYETALNDLGQSLEQLYRNGIYKTQETWHQLATIGRVFEDEEMSEIALRVQEETIGLSHPVTQKTVQALLKILHEKGKTDKEEVLLQRCKDAGVDVPLYLENEKLESQAGSGEGDNASLTEETAVTGEDSGEEVVQNVLDSTPERSAKSLGKMRTF